jgi:hypothetical protein
MMGMVIEEIDADYDYATQTLAECAAFDMVVSMLPHQVETGRGRRKLPHEYWDDVDEQFAPVTGF